jgi:threonine dehydrogenase-like Zn-dependent dehydrogenase
VRGSGRASHSPRVLIQLIWDRKIDPGKVFDLTLPLEQAAEGYKAMDERRATKVLLTLS